MKPGETVECYSKRVGDDNDRQDDEVRPSRNVIENTTITVDNNRTTQNTFHLEPGYDRTPTHWTFSGGANLDGVPFTSNGATADFSGTFNPAAAGNQYNVTVTALDGAGVIDSKGYSFGIPKNGECTFKLEFPLPGGVVNSGFGMRTHPISGTQKMHTGIDIKMPDRSVKDVIASYDGTVVKAGWNNGYGNTVDIEHKDCTGKVVCTTRYGHLASIYVGAGSKVRTGQAVGKEGSTGASTGNHLHFEVMTPGGAKTDPMPWFKGTTTEQKKSSNPAVTTTTPVQRTSPSVISKTDMTARDC